VDIKNESPAGGANELPFWNAFQFFPPQFGGPLFGLTNCAPHRFIFFSFRPSSGLQPYPLLALAIRHLQLATSGGVSSRNLAPPARSISGGRKPPRPTTSTPSKKQRQSFVDPLPRPTAPPGGGPRTFVFFFQTSNKSSFKDPNNNDACCFHLDLHLNDVWCITVVACCFHFVQSQNAE